MNPMNEKYAGYALCRDMTDSVELVEKFPLDSVEPFAESARRWPRGLFLTGEGSSRIFPAKNARSLALRKAAETPVFTEGASQASEYDLTGFCVFAASNSGRTREVVRLVRKLGGSKNGGLFGVTAHRDSPLAESCGRTYVLSCGAEGAVAATKSVMEQALFYHALLERLEGGRLTGLDEAAGKLREVLELPLDPETVKTIASAETVYFAGRNDGVAEELALKTNEIVRKKSAFLEGTYAVHGMEEVVNKGDVLILVDPFPEEESKFREVFVNKIGIPVFALADRKTTFSGLRIPDGGAFRSYVSLAAGWNMLVEVGLSCGIDIDKPLRARKVGNEVQT